MWRVLPADQAQEKFFGDGVDAVHVDNVSADADLGQDVCAVGELADCNLAGGELAGAEHQSYCQLADADRTEAGLAKGAQEANAQLADCDEPHRELADCDDSIRDSANCDDSVSRHALAGLWASAVGVMQKR